MQGLLTKTATLCKAIVTVEADETRGFGRINLKSIKVGQKIPFDLYLKYLSDCHTQANYLLGCSRNHSFHEAWAKKLEDMGIQWVYFASQDQNLVLRYLAANFRDTLLEDGLEPMDRMVLIHDTLYIWMHIFFATERKRTGPLIKLALTLVDDLVGLVDEDENFIEVFVNISRHGELLYSHSLNVALMNLAFCRYLAWPREDAISFGLGGLLHDIGMTQIPREIVEKPAALTPEEEALVHRHPQDGYNFLMKSAPHPQGNHAHDSAAPRRRRRLRLPLGLAHEGNPPVGEDSPDHRQLRKRHRRAALARPREPLQCPVANEKRVAADPRL